ncbi:MAG TPA: hypothetical protein VG755_11900 [Nannocystaceae bacterium]|nr:hypothetical protein [Nannocystaceae bacterium]
MRETQALSLGHAEPSTQEGEITITRRIGEQDDAAGRLDWFTAGLGLLASSGVLCLLGTRPGVPEHVATALPWTAAAAFVTGLVVLAWVNRRRPPRQTICVYVVACGRGSPRAIRAALTHARADEPRAVVWLVADVAWPREVAASLLGEGARCFEPRGATFVERRSA